jgi:hypothetical protein
MELERQSFRKDIARSLRLQPVRNCLELLQFQTHDVLYATFVLHV